ncbi:glycosyltransferase family 4 protein [Riemerella anatipestifer]|nr:glycosyltransferase family 4 protein [Riemerella anatipestifer]MBT0561222.1 glycosyltransferase family 4 protein [Riemerella anatipestifer]OBP57172.1 capsule biosynthesis protein CapM [Riemerella anatipestifer]OBP60831.1 capsule biosynthesis protein CapM [Riemerella anatipestifer]QZO85988.1 glycosyltransferase [Riemerella anatipestifer]
MPKHNLINSIKNCSMNLIFITDNRFFKTKNKDYYTHDIAFGNSLWDRYLRYFDSVEVVGRVFESELQNFSPSNLITNVVIKEIQPFDNPFSFYRHKGKIKKQLIQYLQNQKEAVVIIRGGGALCYLASQICHKMAIPYGMEVIGDPYEVFAPGVLKHPLRPVLRHLFTKYQKEMVYQASSVIYVTKEALQKRYPVRESVFTTYASDVFVSEVSGKERTLISSHPIRLISVGSLDQMYKSPEIALQVVHKLVNKGINVHLTWLGKGVFMEDMLKLSQELNIQDKVYFLGAVSAMEVKRQLDQSDIFILLSKTEGLPRAMVEAMSKGLPCIGTKVGGIPELISTECLVEVGAIDEVCDIIETMIEKTSFYQDKSKENLDRSKEYLNDFLERKREQFFEYLKKRSIQERSIK